MSTEHSVLTVVDGREITVSNLDKVLFPSTGFTKGQVLNYCAQVADVMLAHVGDRPLTMKRFPNGVGHRYFFEKHMSVHALPWIRHQVVPSTADGDSVDYPVMCDGPSLVWAANLAALEFHVPLWHLGRRRVLPAPPDHMVFDLDPGDGSSLVECCRVAGLIAEVLDERRSGCWPKTSGSKGLQLYVPVSGKPTWEKIRARAHGIAVYLEREHPDMVVSNMRKNLRRDKVLIDWSQNHPAKTTIAAYSLRGSEEPTVSTPISWEEVDSCAATEDPNPIRFTADAVLERIAAMGDLFAPVQEVTTANGGRIERDG